MTVRPVSMSKKHGVIFFEDGSWSKMQNFVDKYGEDTDDINEAVSAVALLSNGHWLVVDFSEYQEFVRH